MKVLIDGKEVTVLNEVRFITEIGDSENHQLHTVINHEGIVYDAINDQGQVTLTDSETFLETLDRLIDDAFSNVVEPFFRGV